jgi:hypothetical protein
LADQPGLPWLYPYLEDAGSTRLGLPVFQPFVPVSVVGPVGTSPIHDGLIDTGADAILSSDLVADYVGLGQPPPAVPPTDARHRPLNGPIK